MISQIKRRDDIVKAMNRKEGDVVIEHQGGKTTFHSIFTKNTYHKHLIENVISRTFGYIPKDMIFEDSECTTFEGNRLANDVVRSQCGLGQWLHVATLCSDGIESTPYTMMRLERRSKKDNLQIKFRHDIDIGGAMVRQLINDLTLFGDFALLKESDLTDVDELGNAVVQQGIVQNPAGKFITHGICNQCNESTDCMFFDTLDEAVAYKDGDIQCPSCYAKECENSGECEYCIRHERDCPVEERDHNVMCEHFEFNDGYWDDYDDCDNVCSCPLER